VKTASGIAIAVALLVLCGNLPARNDAPAAEPVAAVPPPVDPIIDASDLGAWLDGFMTASLEQGKIAGAVVSVVQDGELLLSEGYGLADVEARKPMDPARTLVRVGSTAKLFTWTAVMQLFERGELALDRDVSAYLDFALPARPDGPVTLIDLMNHRGGFEEGLREILATDPDRFVTTERYLKEHPRPRIFPAGSVPAYSNFGTALAGYIVERVSGEPFDDYVEHHMLDPLGMQRSTFRQPLPREFGADVSAGYIRGDRPPWAFELISTAPAGALSTTANDMAQFMIAHLQAGRYGSRQILQPETARLMHSDSVAAPAGFATMAHGFFRSTENGRTILGHGGDTILFHSDLNLIPDAGIGIFVSFNSRGMQGAAYGIRRELFGSFMDRYFPDTDLERHAAALPDAAAHAKAVAGSYESSRRIETAFLRAVYLMQQTTVTAHEDGTISLSSEPDKRFREVAPDRWREVDGERALQVTQVDGRRTIADSENPVSVLQAVPLAKNASLIGIVLLGAAAVLLAVLMAWPVDWLYRRAYRAPIGIRGKALLAHRAVRVAAAADFVYLFGWYLALRPLLQNRLDAYGPSFDGLLVTLQLGAVVPLAGAAAGLWNAWLTIRSERRWPAKLGNALLALALLGIAWVGWAAGLIGFNREY